MNEKVKVYLWMNALLEPKLLNPRKTMICWQPNPITSLEIPSDSFCVVEGFIFLSLLDCGVFLFDYAGYGSTDVSITGCCKF